MVFLAASSVVGLGSWGVNKIKKLILDNFRFFRNKQVDIDVINVETCNSQTPSLSKYEGKLG
jgi:hypothetical protein